MKKVSTQSVTRPMPDRRPIWRRMPFKTLTRLERVHPDWQARNPAQTDYVLRCEHCQRNRDGRCHAAREGYPLPASGECYRTAFRAAAPYGSCFLWQSRYTGRGLVPASFDFLLLREWLVWWAFDNLGFKPEGYC